MERTGVTEKQAYCSYEEKEYPLGYELCMDSTDCRICHNGTWVDREMGVSE